MTDSTERAVVSTTRAAQMLAVSDETIKRYVKAGKLEGFVLPGGYYRIYHDSVVKLMGGAS